MPAVDIPYGMKELVFRIFDVTISENINSNASYI